MRIPTLSKTLAAAALTIGLVAGAPAAQAAPPTSPAAHGHHVVVGHAAKAPVKKAHAKKAAKARTKIAVAAPAEVKAGDDLTITATMTRKVGKKFKPYASKKLALVVLDAPGADTGEIVLVKKTNKKGVATFVLDTTDPEVAGKSYDFLVAYAGGSKARPSESDVVTVSITAA